MTLADAIAKIGERLDDFFEGRLLEYADMLREKGATQYEVEVELKIQRTQFADFRAITLHDLTEQLSRDGKTLN